MDIAQAMSVLRKAGKRVTAERRLLLQLIAHNAHLDAGELYDLAKKEDPRINLSTVYRTVKLFAELELIEASNLGHGHEHYEVRLRNHYHCVCLICGRVFEIPPLVSPNSLVVPAGFELVGAKVELFGYCRECCRDKGRTTASDGAD